MTDRQDLPAIFEASLRDGLIRYAGGSIGFDDVNARVSKLRTSGLEDRQAVGMVFENGTACLETYAAFAFLGIVAVPLPPTLPEVERLRLWGRLGCTRYADASGVHEISGSPGRGGIRWPEGIHWVMHSSGSTGIPKAIPLTLEAVQTNADGVMEILGTGTTVSHIGSMSQCYTNGLFNSFLLPLLTGGKCLVAPVASALKLRQYVETIRNECAQIAWVNPTVVSMLIRHASLQDLASVELFISCTAPLSQAQCLAAESKFGRPVLQSFGTTETLIVSVESPSRDAHHGFSSGRIVGGPAAVSIGEDSVLTIRNGAVTPGYAECHLGDLELSLLGHGSPGKFFVSGDLARINSAGSLEIIGRTTNVINVEGVKVSAEQLEEILRSDPNVVDSAVVAGKDSEGNERPVGFLEVRADVNTSLLIDLCAAKLGAKARLADLRIVDALPRTSNGKVDRAGLAATVLRS